MDVVTPDYYATLGVAPSSEDVVIRAAYLALMRRYHPDRNPSADAAARARAITTAYAVLSDWERRAEYDLIRAEGAAAYFPPRRARPSPTALFAAAAIALLLMVVIWPALPERERPGRAAAGQAPQVAAAKPNPAAQVRRPPDIGDEEPAKARPPLVEPPAPPPVRVVSVPPPVRMAPVRVAPARVASARAAPARVTPTPPARAAPASVTPPPPAKAVPDPPPAGVAPEPTVAQAKPSFSCRYAMGRGENAVCGNANLARLDRHLAVFYGQSWGQADAARRERLLSTRERFLARRDACRSDSCVNGVYVRRMREVSEIMATK